MKKSRASRQGFVLIELLVAVAIICLLVVAYFGLTGKKGSQAGKGQPEQGKTQLGQALDKGHSVECANNLRQLRSELQMRLQENEAWPATLDGLSMPTKCPVSGQPYTYNPQTGELKCTTPGHEKL